jgi:hypothetical protein
MEFMYQLQQILSKETKSIAVLFLFYGISHSPTTSPSFPFNHALTHPRPRPNSQIPPPAPTSRRPPLPRPRQATQALPKPNPNRRLRGANLALALLSHTLHSHPSTTTPIPPLALEAPLRALVLTSPWVSFSTAAPAFVRNAK